jgi:ribosome-binding protein aMBF1 (putative translation factor)
MQQCGKETERTETAPNGDIIFVCDECAERAKMIKQKMDK